jgi:hypothetical protein
MRLFVSVGPILTSEWNPASVAQLSFRPGFGSLQRFRLTPFVSISILMRRVTLRPKGRGASLDRARTIRTAKRS